MCEYMCVFYGSQLSSIPPFLSLAHATDTPMNFCPCRQLLILSICPLGFLSSSLPGSQCLKHDVELQLERESTPRCYGRAAPGKPTWDSARPGAAHARGGGGRGRTCAPCTRVHAPECLHRSLPTLARPDPDPGYPVRSLAPAAA